MVGHRGILASRRMNALQAEIDEGIRVLKAGGVLAFPTDTVYGMGTDAFNASAVERLYRIKNRSPQQAFPVLISDISQLSTMSRNISGIAWFMARRFWPGGLTLVLPIAASVPAYLASGSTIALRVPNHRVCLALLQLLGNPLIGTSANISGAPAALSADEVEQHMGAEVDFIIKGGDRPSATESTIVDVTGGAPVVLRPGIIPEYQIDRAHREYMEANNDACCRRM